MSGRLIYATWNVDARSRIVPLAEPISRLSWTCPSLGTLGPLPTTKPCPRLLLGDSETAYPGHLLSPSRARTRRYRGPSLGDVNPIADLQHCSCFV